MTDKTTIRMEREQQKKTEYMEIDVHGLASALAESDYRKETHGIPEKDLWQVDMVEKSGQVYIEKDIHSHWASLFYQLYRNYKSLIVSYAKKKTK